MEAEFDDFLKYLDFGGSVISHGAAGVAGSRDDSGLSSMSSDKSTSASPQDKIFSDFGGSSHSNSPQAAQLSFPGGPAPSVVFNDGYNSSGASWGAISNQSNSPPFDASIYGSPVLQQQPQFQQPNHRGSFDFNAFGSLNLQNFTQPNMQQNDLSPQLQLLLLQQAQLNMQTQPHNQNYQQPLQYQQQPVQHQQPPMFHQQPYEQQYQQLALQQQQQPQQTQYQAVPAIKQSQPADHQIRRMSVQHPAPLNLAAASQSYPSGQNSTVGGMTKSSLPEPPQANATQSNLSLLPTNTTQPLAPNMKKATLKRSYQQVKSEEDVLDYALTQDASEPLQRSTSQTTEPASGEDAEPKSGNRGGHNAVEQKYRRGINDSLIMLREIVPALGHLRAAPGAAPSKRKASQFSLAAAATPAAPSELVDGVIPPKKLSKQLILVTATDYIRYLASRREELEGELRTLRQTLDECLEDSKLVFDLAEGKFAPERARILSRRQEIYADRTSAKESSKKRKVDGDSAGKKSRGSAKDGSDDDSDDSGDDDEVEQETFAISSALPAKTQAKSRGRPKKAATSAGQPFAPPYQQQGPPKALLSIFGGISFIGGAGYDLLYGASSTTAASQADTVNPARVWSHGLVKRSPAAVLPTHEDQLNTMQRFLIGRPALLSGIVTFTLGLVLAYTLFYAVPQSYNRFTKSNRLAAKARARDTLIAMSKEATKQTANERSALAILAGTPQSSFLQVLYAIVLFVQAAFFGCIGWPKASADRTAAVEQAASSIRLLEVDNNNTTSSSLQRLSSFLHLYVLMRSSSWPGQDSANDMTAQANAVLSLTSPNVFGKKGVPFAKARWQAAQDQIKKHAETARPWLKSALSMKHEEIVELGITSLSELAERQYSATLLQAWRELFSHVMLATNAAGSTKEQMTAHKKSVDTGKALEEMLSSLPPSSINRSLILLYRGVEAMEVNDKARVIQIAVELSKTSQKSAGVQAYLDMVTGSGFPDPPATFNSHSDCLAYVTVAWLRLRAASPSSSPSQGSIKVNDALQVSAVKVRKLLAEDVFDGTGSDSHFLEAQESCLEGLVRISRQAAGLYAESDSGCEL